MTERDRVAVCVYASRVGTGFRNPCEYDRRERFVAVEVLIILAARLAATHIDEGSNGRIFERAYKHLRAHRVDDDFVFLAVHRTQSYDAIVRIAGNPELIRINAAEQTQLVRLQVQPFLTEASATGSSSIIRCSPKQFKMAMHPVRNESCARIRAEASCVSERCPTPSPPSRSGGVPGTIRHGALIV